MVVLRGQRVLLRTGHLGDTDALFKIRNEPEVLRWWGEADIEEISEEFIGTNECFVIETNGNVIGGIQYGEEDDPMYRHANVDIFITTARHGQGLGFEAIRVLVRHLFEDRGHHRLTIDPAADNSTAVRVYEQVGFHRVGIMREYERGPDGVWHDGLLMDMLQEEFCPGQMPPQTT